MYLILKYPYHTQIDVNKGRTSDGLTALIEATNNGNNAIVELLLGHPGIDPNQGRNSMMIDSSVQDGQSGSIRALVAYFCFNYLIYTLIFVLFIIEFQISYSGPDKQF